MQQCEAPLRNSFYFQFLKQRVNPPEPSKFQTQKKSKERSIIIKKRTPIQRTDAYEVQDTNTSQFDVSEPLRTCKTSDYGVDESIRLEIPSATNIFSSPPSSLTTRSHLRSIRKKCRACETCHEFSQFKKYMSCGHKLFCIECAQMYLEYQINDNQIQLKCEAENCTGYANPESDFFRDQLDEKLKKRLNRNRKKQLENAQDCRTVNCAGVIEVKLEIPKCNQCLKEYCTECQEERHTGKCTKKDKVDAQKIYGQGTKFCSQCKGPIFKDGGCNHITCSNCKYQFCFVCLKKWNKTHHFCSEQKGIFSGVKNFFRLFSRS